MLARSSFTRISLGRYSSMSRTTKSDRRSFSGGTDLGPAAVWFRRQLQFGKPRRSAVHLVNVIAAEKLRQAVEPITPDHPLQPIRQDIGNAFPQAASEQPHAGRRHFPERAIRVQERSQTGGQNVPGISPEAFVATVAGQGNGYLLPGEPRQKQRRNLQLIGERLVPDRRKFGNDRPGLRGGEA